MSGTSEKPVRKTSAATAGLVIAVIILAGALGFLSTQTPTTKVVTQTVLQTVTQTVTTTAAAPSPVAPPSPPPAPTVSGKPKILRIGVNSFGANLLDPTVCSTGFCAQVDIQIYEKLIDFDVRGKDFINLKPKLAESMEISPDGLTYTFKLRKGILFHTGNEMTADAVVFTIKRLTHPNFTLPYFPGKQPYPAQYGPYIDENSAKAIDKYTVQIKLKKPSAIFPIFLGGVVVPYGAVLDPVLMKNAKKVLNGTDWGAQWLIEGHDVGTGPYFVKEWVPDQRLVLAAYPLYWQGKPPIDEVHYISVKDASVQALMLARGDLHWARDVGVEQLPSLKDSPNVKVLKALDPSAMGLAFNANRTNSPEPLKNFKVRQAMAYLMDWETILNKLLGEAGAPMYGIYPKGVPGWDAFGGQPLYKYDLAKAKQLLAEAGYPNGIPEKLKIFHYEHGLGGFPWQDVALFIRDTFAKAGIQLELETGPVATIESKYRAGDFHMFLTWHGLFYNDPDGAVSIMLIQWARGGFKWSLADDLKQRGVETVDPAKRAEIYTRFQKEVYSTTLYTFEYLQYGLFLPVSPKLTGVYIPNVIATYPSWQFYYMDLQE